MRLGYNTDFDILNRLFDDDHTCHAGFQIGSVRKTKKKVPDWAVSNKRIAKLLLRVFPKLATSEGQRRRAARWAAVIYLSYRAGLSDRTIADQLGGTRYSIKQCRYRASLAAAGFSTGGALPKRRGRPNKIPLLSAPFIEAVEDRSSEPMPASVQGAGAASKS